MKLSFLILTLVFLSSAPIILAKTKEEWRNRTIYQLLTDRFAQPPNNKTSLCASNAVESEVRHYCGGTFSGIVDQLDYIQEMGFDAIWISPVVKQSEYETQYGLPFHGYWAQDLYEINPHFGSENDLVNLVNAAHNKGIWVMVDVVANHMAPQSGKTPGTPDFVMIYDPFNKTEHYHSYCNIFNYNNQGEVEYCCLGGTDLPLPDLNTENQFVIAQLYSWISNLVNTYNFDGIRIDTVKHIRKDFWDGFTKSAGVFSIGEVAHGDPGYVGDYQNHVDATLGYPMYYVINSLYTYPGNSMYRMRDALNQNRQYFKDTTVLGNFLDNHDVQRFQSQTQDQTLLRNALTFVLLADGIPIIYQGTEQNFRGNPNTNNGGNDPWNREALWSSNYSRNTTTYQLIAIINKLRKRLTAEYFSSTLIEAWIDDHIYAFMKEKAMVITSNYGSQNPNRDITIQGNGRWQSGVVLVNVVNCFEQITVDGNGNVPVHFNPEPKVLYPIDQLKGAGVCGL